MELNISSMLIIFLIFFLFSQLQAVSSTIFVDGVSEWKNPNVHVGNTIIFKHKYNYNLYIFKNKNAFNLCNFTQATLLTKPNSTSFKWHPSRPGIFYFTFNNGSFKTCKSDSQSRLSIKVSAVSSTPPPSPSPEKPPMMSAPTPASGGSVSSSPEYPWPSRPREAAVSSPSPASMSAATSPMTVTEIGGGIPFINSNPAVPLPTGEVDSATIRPLPTSGHVNQQEMGLLASQILVLLFSAIFLMP